MKVTYIEHSGFWLELADVCFLFDYYRGTIPAADANKPLIVFVSHKHEDHYNPAVFELVKQYPDIKFVLSKDIFTKWKISEYEEKGINLSEHIVTAPGNALWSMELSNGKELKIETLHSTDAGVAFFLTYEGKNFYHAGDLNLWIWKEETKQYNNNMKAAYFRELEKLKGRKIAAGFVPLDPRLEDYSGAGLESFMEYTQCSHVFPMHFWGQYSIISEFLEKHPEYEGRIARIQRTGQEFWIE